MIQKIDKILTKKPVIAGELLFLAVVGYMTFFSDGNDKKKSTVPAEQNVSVKQDELAADKKQQPIMDFTKNPFGDISEFEGDQKSTAGRQLTPVPAIPHGKIPLPSFPGGISIPREQGPVAVASVPKVQGVLTADGGGNIAIMSDGRVVGEGDSIDNHRIAYIGGDGISFDNGDFWSYGSNKE